jgi:hypothetical protein
MGRRKEAAITHIRISHRTRELIDGLRKEVLL